MLATSGMSQSSIAPGRPTRRARGSRAAVRRSGTPGTRRCRRPAQNCPPSPRTSTQRVRHARAAPREQRAQLAPHRARHRVELARVRQHDGRDAAVRRAGDLNRSAQPPPVAFTTSAQRHLELDELAEASPPRGWANSAPWPVPGGLSSGVCSALRTASHRRLRLRGVPLGAQMPYQVADVVVRQADFLGRGHVGEAGLRLAPGHHQMALMRPPLM
jgi:hypothetical protein